MNRALASIGIAAAVVCGSAATAPQSGMSTPSAKPSHSETTTHSTWPSTKAETPKTSETNLAKTGTYAGVLAVLVPLIAAVGTITNIASRKEDN